MDKRKLIYLYCFIMIFLVNSIVYSQYIPYQGGEITTDEGFKIKLRITCYDDDPIKRFDISINCCGLLRIAKESQISSGLIENNN